LLSETPPSSDGASPETPGARRGGRPRRNSDPSVEFEWLGLGTDKDAVRRARNREAQLRFRERQKKKIEDLEAAIKALLDK
ncbi:unnamed protein product, partial [Ostreobium quekettii]